MDKNNITPVPSETIAKDSEFQNDEFLAKRERSKNQKILFFSVLGSSALLMVIALGSAVYELLGTPSTQEVAIIALMLTAPIILILALMRYVYDGKKADDPQPTLMLNIGKEFASVLQTIFKK